MKRVIIPFVLLLLFASPTLQAQGGAYTAPADLDHLVQTAQLIIRGSVVSANVEPHPQFHNLETVVVTISVSKVIKGDAQSTLTFRQYLLDARDVPAFAGYKSSGELLLFLNPVSPFGLTSTVGLEQGRFRILRDSKGNRYAVNGRGNLGLFGEVTNKASSRGLRFSKQVREMLAKPSGQVPLETLEEAIRALAGVAR